MSEFVIRSAAGGLFGQAVLIAYACFRGSTRHLFEHPGNYRTC